MLELSVGLTVRSVSLRNTSAPLTSLLNKFSQISIIDDLAVYAALGTISDSYT